MEKDQPSRTSEAAAVHRAVHQLLDDEPKILLDPIALRIVEMPKDIDLNVDSAGIERVPNSNDLLRGQSLKLPAGLWYS